MMAEYAQTHMQLVQWCTSIILALGRQREKDYKLANLSYTANVKQALFGDRTSGRGKVKGEGGGTCVNMTEVLCMHV
jgi:hypothetical protein